MALALRKPPSLASKMDAYPYQLDAVRSIRELQYAAIFHEQGLGKTKIAIDLMLLWLEQDIVDTVFVITKKMLVENWHQELVAHSYITPRILAGNRRENSVALNSPVLIYVMNYEVISTNLEIIRLFLGTCRVAVFLDESQKIKNPDANISVSLLSIAHCFTRRIVITGTPVANRPHDIWAQIKFLDGGKSLGDSFTQFKAKYDLPNASLSSHAYEEILSDTMDKIGSFSVRETKESAGIKLPNKTILSHFARMAGQQTSIYDSYRHQLRYQIVSDSYRVDDAEDLLKRLLRLVQCASNPFLVDKSYNETPGKYSLLKRLLDDINIHQHKVIIWSTFVDNVIWLAEKLTDYSPCVIHGRMLVGQRNQAVQRFKNDGNCRVLVATPGAAKEGLTLTVANHVIFYDRSFSLDDYVQAQDRIHRISQSIDCFVHNLIARDTIDEWVDILLNIKHQASLLTHGDSSAAGLPIYDLRRDLARILAPSLHSE